MSLRNTKSNSSLSHQSAFSEAMFRRYFPASCFATLSGWVSRFLIGWTAWELTHSAFWVGMVAASMLLPTFLFSPMFGIVSDRINPRTGVIFTTTGQGLVAALAGVSQALNMLNLPLLIFLAVLLGIVTSAHQPIRLSLIPRLVPKRALPSAIGYGAMLFNSSRIIGPAIGAWLVAAFSVSIAFFVASFFSILAILTFMTLRGISASGKERDGSFFNELKAGFVYAVSHPIIRLVLFFTLINGLLGRTLLELLPAFSGQLLGGTAETLATLSAIAGGGSIAGGLFVSRLGSEQERLIRLVFNCLIVSVVCLFAVQWLNGLYQLCALIFVLSMMTTIAGTGGQALAQLLVDDSYRGRVLSFWSMLAMGAPAVGAVAIGALAQAFGFPVVTAGNAVVALVVLFVIYKIIEQKNK